MKMLTSTCRKPLSVEWLADMPSKVLSTSFISLFSLINNAWYFVKLHQLLLVGGEVWNSWQLAAIYMLKTSNRIKIFKIIMAPEIGSVEVYLVRRLRLPCASDHFLVVSVIWAALATQSLNTLWQPAETGFLYPSSTYTVCTWLRSTIVNSLHDDVLLVACKNFHPAIQITWPDTCSSITALC